MPRGREGIERRMPEKTEMKLFSSNLGGGAQGSLTAQGTHPGWGQGHTEVGVSLSSKHQL